VPNPGNAGDALISYGCLKILNSLKIKYKFAGPYGYKGKFSNSVILYGGGGSPSHISRLIGKNQNENEIIVLPATLFGKEELFSNLNESTKIFCREKTSYEFIESLSKKKENVFLSKDMAFYIGDEFIEFNNKNISELIPVLNAYNEAEEKGKLPIPEDNIDISDKLRIKNSNGYRVVKRIPKNFFWEISKYKEVNTSRLHVAIAAALLDKTVNLYSNSYYKCRAVYEYSLQDFKNVNFIK
jgi:exopolysaccharide biosynthesis predicted pyruvyltransferase EpsI